MKIFFLSSIALTNSKRGWTVHEPLSFPRAVKVTLGPRSSPGLLTELIKVQPPLDSLQRRTLKSIYDLQF
jgi:hypothetical protein